MLWPATVTAVQAGRNGVAVLSMPFGILAENFHEAVGKATACMEKVKLQKPGYTNWMVSVNKLGPKGFIANPETADLF